MIQGRLIRETEVVILTSSSLSEKEFNHFFQYSNCKDVCIISAATTSGLHSSHIHIRRPIEVQIQLIPMHSFE